MSRGTLAINGLRVRELREARLMGVRELSRLASVTHYTVMGIERGTRPMVYRETLRKLAAALDVAPGELLRGGSDADRDDDG